MVGRGGKHRIPHRPFRVNKQEHIINFLWVVNSSNGFAKEQVNKNN
jgi:hypothetical protein